MNICASLTGNRISIKNSLKKERKEVVMTVIELKATLDDYDDNAEIVVVDFTNGRKYDLFIGSDDDGEGTETCTFSFERTERRENEKRDRDQRGRA